MIPTAEVLKLLSTNNKKYNKNNVKIHLKKDGVYSTGNAKYLAIISDLSGVELLKCAACLTTDKKVLFDESVFYQVEYTIEE